MKMLTLSIWITGAALVTTSPAARAFEDDATAAYALGDTVEDFSLPDLDGNEHSLASLRDAGDDGDKIVVIDFWSPKCPWSRGYDERFRDLVAHYEGQPVSFVMIDANVTDSKDVIANYLGEKDLPFLVLIDEGNVIADRFDGQTTPHVFVLDGESVLRYRGGVDDDVKGEKADEARTTWVRDAIDALLAGEAPPVAETQNFGCSIKRVGSSRKASS